jgi:hypothetical protein
MVQELLNIEGFYQRKFSKKKRILFFREMQVSSWYCWKALDESGLLEVIL